MTIKICRGPSHERELDFKGGIMVVCVDLVKELSDKVHELRHSRLVLQKRHVDRIEFWQDQNCASVAVLKLFRTINNARVAKGNLVGWDQLLGFFSEESQLQIPLVVTGTCCCKVRIIVVEVFWMKKNRIVSPNIIQASEPT